MKKRVWVLFFGMLAAFGGIAIRLLAVSAGTVAVSTEQSTETQTIAVARGTFYDRYGQPLVNRSYGVLASVAPFEPTLQALEDGGETKARRYVQSLAEYGERVTVPLEDWLPPTTGIAQVWVPDRYAEEPLCCHLLGYINGYSEGVSGLEKVFDDTLSRYSGEASVTYHVDALGRTAIQGETTVNNTLPLAKGGVMLTVDAQIQAITQTVAARMLDRGAVLVSSAESGELLATVSLPLFDPDKIERAISDKHSPLLDRTLINYDLGSVFKLITAASALENGIPPTRAYTCRGACDFDGIVIRCHNPLGDGTLTMEEALACSCNCYFMELAKELGAEELTETARRAGFDAALTPVDGYRTARALMPTLQELSSPAALANMSIGQGALMASPVHVHAVMTSIARNGMWCVPAVYRGEVNEHGVTVRENPPEREERWLSENTARSLLRMLSAVVVSGTGSAAAPSELTAAGKTGTAETGWEIDGAAVEHSWFTGVYPDEHPQYVITVLSENGGVSGKTAAPVFRSICDELFQAGLVEKGTPTP